MEPNRNYSAAAYAGGVARAEVDEGLRRYMLRVYNTMALGVAGTGVVVLALAAMPQLLVTLAVGPMKWVFFLAVLGLGFMAPKIVTMKSTAMAHAMYWAYVACWGILIAPMVAWFLQSTEGTMDIARAFFITSAMFAGASLFGYTTKKDLSPIGKFLVMAVIGLLVAMLVNYFFVESTGFSLLISIAVVLLFAGITAWETQAIKEMYTDAYGDGVVSRMAIFGAFILYGSFVTMFMHMLNIIAILRGGE